MANKVYKESQLKGLRVQDFKVPKDMPAGYLGVLQELVEAANPAAAPSSGAPLNAAGSEAAIVKATAAGFEQFANALDKVLQKGKQELVVVDLTDALRKNTTPLLALFPAEVLPHANAVSVQATYQLPVCMQPCYAQVIELASWIKRKKKHGIVAPFCAVELKKFLPPRYVLCIILYM